MENWPRNERLTIIGSGDLEPMVREAAAKEPEAFEYVGQLPYPEARALVAGSKGVVVSSRWPETGPLTAIEALQSGTPLAVSASIAQADELTKNGAGVKFDIDASGESLGAALARLGQGAVTRDNARARFEQEFSAAVWLSRVERTYAKVLNKGESA
jgi:glycosyltransferase involved in cell wall biosynthesis